MVAVNPRRGTRLFLPVYVKIVIQLFTVGNQRRLRCDVTGFFDVSRVLVGRSLAWGRSGVIILDAVFGSRFQWRSRPWESRFEAAGQKPRVELATRR